MFFCSDGAKSNRRFYHLHADSSSKQPTYKVSNPFADEERNIYFISDPPHLVKTLRNCLSNSGAHNRARHMWVSHPFGYIIIPVYIIIIIIIECIL